jgi:hypothetical protein
MMTRDDDKYTKIKTTINTKIRYNTRNEMLKYGKTGNDKEEEEKMKIKG